MGASDTITIAQLFGPKRSPFSPPKPPTSQKDGGVGDEDDQEEEEDVVSVYVPLHKSMTISLATMDGPGALKGRIYYKMVESSSSPPQDAAAAPKKAMSLKSGTIHSLSKKEAASAPIRCIEFSPVALK